MTQSSTTNYAPDLGLILDRLRGNLRAAGIPVTDEEIALMAESGFLRPVQAFEKMSHGKPVDIVPEYLGAWGYALKAADKVDPREQRHDDHAPHPAHDAALPDWSQASVLEIARALETRSVSPVELTERALERIAECNPYLNAFQLVLAERARAAARRAEAEIGRGEYRGPLHGVPVAVKDLLAMKDTVTTAGTKIHAERVTDFDSTAVARLEAAGAIILGKTRMSEFAYSPGSNNDHFGATRNPRNPEHDTGGSSSGSAAAVADGLVFAALGTDTGGSIRIPASFCGIVGLKPTFGRLSLHGSTTLAWSLDHLGPMTRTVKDAGVLLAALAGEDRLDPRTRHISEPDAALRAWGRGAPRLEAGVKGLRVGVLREDGSGRPLASPEILEAWKAGLDALARAGAELVEVDVPQLQPLRVLSGALLAIEAVAYHLPLLQTRLADYGEFMRLRFLAGFAYAPTAFVRAQQLHLSARREVNDLFEQVHLLSTPTMPTLAPSLGTPARLSFTAPFNLLGWPAITLPVGEGGEKLPIGLQLVGKPWDEATLLRAAHVLEEELRQGSGIA